jgi:hypothetical protein
MVSGAVCMVLNGSDGVSLLALQSICRRQTLRCLNVRRDRDSDTEQSSKILEEVRTCALICTNLVVGSIAHGLRLLPHLNVVIGSPESAGDYF